MMLGMEEVIMSEIKGEEELNENGLALPPGFRFHPTDEELISFYLASKVFHGDGPFFSSSSSSSYFNHIAEVDLNRCEPWDLPEMARKGEREWYLFSLKDRKYPSGLRTNRATSAGYWKATGKDREVYSSGFRFLVGMKKTLVFYLGRAPRGLKTNWVMHEYRILHSHFSHSLCYSSISKEEWVICRIFYKTGEKKSPLLLEDEQSNNNNIVEEPEAALPTNTNALPPLIDITPNVLHSLHLQEDNLNSLITNPSILSQSHLFPSFYPPISSNITVPSATSNTIINCTPKANCKTEDNYHENYSLLFEMDEYGDELMGYTHTVTGTAANANTDDAEAEAAVDENDMSPFTPSVAFNRQAFQMILLDT